MIGKDGLILQHVAEAQITAASIDDRGRLSSYHNAIAIAATGISEIGLRSQQLQSIVADV
ncbi:hypothetical protein TIFTF001_015401 [Ficus carica]|uniref:Uncharacterized protein n=1 Tax=Ficus carica TaxID=3494 RepID=A0AA88D537_FICCA|nr:hypothetical protein TIFTF001_015401 [Ficus carica]